MATSKNGVQPRSKQKSPLLIDILVDKASVLHKREVGDLGCIGDESCDCFRHTLGRAAEKLKHRKQRLPHHGRGGSKHVGRVRIKLAKILSECLGLECYPEDLSPTQGRYRTDKSCDAYAWEVFTTTANGMKFVAGSFDTMTSCVKAGKVSINAGEIHADFSGMPEVAQ